ncbi:hypothetical protein OGAPHI_006315 [Ogataea philodendri]|uniref:CRIB domain-containing protein n=1 Tax=Ogataea philodendri TaxID=1378263 RepID=A0A9P8T1G6_9ASCO|nr:uncharacterized protein OGAPHI_006315 [Ogataea philodendri]KAH3662134.1 hypothetical protein OGAPHI_006315 [Ogataea philodendri]
MSPSPKLESLWLDEPSTRKKDKVLRSLQSKRDLLLQLFELDGEFPKKGKKSTLTISTPFAFTHTSHLSERECFGLEKAFREEDLDFIPSILKTELPTSGNARRPVSSFRTSPTAASPIISESRPVSRHYRVNSTSSTSQLFSRANSTFTRSTSISTLSSLNPSIQESPVRTLRPPDRLPSIPQENSEQEVVKSLENTPENWLSLSVNTERNHELFEPVSEEPEDIRLRKFEFPSFLMDTPTDTTPTDPPHIRKVPSIGSPIHSRDSSFTFELFHPLDHAGSGSPANKLELLPSPVDSQDVNEISDNEDTLISLNAANVSRLSRLSMATDHDFTENFSKTLSQLRLPDILDEESIDEL